MLHDNCRMIHSLYTHYILRYVYLNIVDIPWHNTDGLFVCMGKIKNIIYNTRWKKRRLRNCLEWGFPTAQEAVHWRTKIYHIYIYASNSWIWIHLQYSTIFSWWVVTLYYDYIVANLHIVSWHVWQSISLALLRKRFGTGLRLASWQWDWQWRV